MAERISMRQKRREAPEWIFPWKPRRTPLLPKLIAVGVAAAMFGGLLGFVRIRTTTPNLWGLDKASVIHMNDSPEGRALALIARENGPNPVRLQSSDWPALVAYEREQFAGIAHPAKIHQPGFRPWRAPPVSNPPLSQPGTGVLPALPAATLKPVTPAEGRTQPVIMALSGMEPGEVPAELPAYDGPLDTAMMSESLRLLVQLDGEGRVLECLALSGADTPEATSRLCQWVRGIRFLRNQGGGPAWAAIRIRFLNQPR